MAKALYEAKKNYIYHSFLNDENIVISQDVYKITGFGFFQFDYQTKCINVNENNRKRMKMQIDDRKLLFMAPELKKFYIEWVQGFTKEKLERRKKLNQDRDKLRSDILQNKRKIEDYLIDASID